MSEEILTPADMGFAEFVAKLISEVFDAVVTSQAEQQEKLLELKELASLPEDMFIDALLADVAFFNQIDSLIESYFPISKKDQEQEIYKEQNHKVFNKSPYQTQKSQGGESPPVLEKTGLDLSQTKPAKETTLNQDDVNQIYRHVAKPFAQQKKSAMVEALEHGFSNIIVDSGKINAKFTFNTSIENQDSDEPSSEQGKIEKGGAGTVDKSTLKQAKSRNKAREALISALTKKKSGSSKNRYIQSTLKTNPRFKSALVKPNLGATRGVTIKPANNRDPQASTTTANIYSEIELNFKSIR